jgi:hypothetical protein
VYDSSFLSLLLTAYCFAMSIFSAMSCCVIPFLLGCIAPCWWANDRQALAQVFNIDDQTSWMTVREIHDSTLRVGFCRPQAFSSASWSYAGVLLVLLWLSRMLALPRAKPYQGQPCWGNVPSNRCSHSPATGRSDSDHVTC